MSKSKILLMAKTKIQQTYTIGMERFPITKILNKLEHFIM